MTAKGNWTKWIGVFLLVSALAVTASARTGSWFDEIIIGEEPDHGKAVLKLQGDNPEIDIYLFPITRLGLIATIEEDDDIVGFTNYGGYREYSFNPSGPIFRDTGKLNPFALPVVREAVNWIIDREYIVGEVLGGAGLPTTTGMLPLFAEVSERYGDIVQEIEDFYDYDPAKGEAIIAKEMLDLGAVLQGGVWHYEGAPVEIIMVIRSDLPPYPEAGDYLADQLETIGFQVVRLYRTSGEAWPIWSGDPDRGLFHIYTGGWGASLVPREQAGFFNQMYTPRGMPFGLWQAYTPSDVMDELSQKILFREFSSLEERREMFEEILWEGMRDSVRIWHTNVAGVSPYRANIAMMSDLAGGPVSTWRWAQVARFVDADGQGVYGGTARIETNSILTQAWNPVEGSSWTYDLLINRNIMGSSGTMPDPNTGLFAPHRIERAELYVKEGLPVGIQADCDWLTLEFVDEIVVPGDAWAYWDPVKQVFITVDEYYPEGTTALRKSVVYYPADLYDVKMHDGSTITIADFILSMIVGFDRGMPESAIFDEMEVSRLAATMRNFRGVRIVSENPLVIETYHNAFALDAENTVSTWWPSYGTYGWTGFWHTIALGILAEETKELAFSSSKAGTLGVEQTDYTKGPSLAILEAGMMKALQEFYLPYAPTMSKYVDFSEASLRWGNLEQFYARLGHFWVSKGPMYLHSVDPTNKIVILRRFTDHPDPVEKYLFLER